MLELIQKILKDVLSSFYQYFGAALITTILFMIVYISFEDKGIRSSIRLLIKRFKQNKKYKYVSVLVLYIFMLLYRTILCRPITGNPLQEVLGTWWIYDKNDELYTEGIENILLFAPLMFLVFLVYNNKFFKQKDIRFIPVIKSSVIVSFTASACIEICQLFLKIGMFQLSDLAFNTLGGLIGGIVFWMIYRKRRNIL